MTRMAVGGLLHETNTFAPTKLRPGIRIKPNGPVSNPPSR
jgi:hypothetical protein